MHYYIDVLKKYVVFSGRARRSEYWYFALFNFLIALVLSVIGITISIASGNFSTMIIAYTISWIYGLAVLLPGLGVAIRRLHDIGKSGWMIFINLIPLIGAIWFLVLMCLDSDPSDNEYGPNPKITSSMPPTTSTQSTNPQ